MHCVGGTTPLLTALGGRWRSGMPLLLTEARAPVARQRPAEERLSPAVRTVLRRFRASVARTGYAEAGLIAPLSAYHHGWALRHGAQADRLVQVPAGVDPSEFPGVAEPETEPAVVWAGSGGPDSGLTPLLAAFEQVASSIPGTVLHLVGVTAAHEDYCAEQIERTGLGRTIRLHPLPADPRDRYTVGHVVAHVPGPGDPPYRLIEAMMSGRAIVGVDVGPAAETHRRGRGAGAAGRPGRTGDRDRPPAAGAEPAAHARRRGPAAGAHPFHQRPGGTRLRRALHRSRRAAPAAGLRTDARRARPPGRRAGDPALAGPRRHRRRAGHVGRPAGPGRAARTRTPDHPPLRCGSTLERPQEDTA